MRNILRATLVTWLVVVAGAVSARAVGPEVRDNAGLFSPGAVKQADETIRTIQRDFRKDLLVETFPGVPDSRTNDYARNREAFFASFVNERAAAARLDGIYVLVMKEAPPHRYRIQVGVGQATRQRAFLNANRDELVRLFQSSFRDDKFDDGLRTSVAYVERTLRSNLSASVPPATMVRSTVPSAAPRAVATTASSSPSIGGMVIVGLFVIGGIILVVVLFRILRSGMGGGGGGVLPGSGGGFGGGGGFFSGLLGGIGGALAGSWLYDRFFSGNAHANDSYPVNQQPDLPPSDVGGDYSSSGGDVGGGDFGSGGGDVGGGGDFGGGGGDFGGGGGFGGGGDA